MLASLAPCTGTRPVRGDGFLFMLISSYLPDKAAHTCASHAGCRQLMG